MRLLFSLALAYCCFAENRKDAAALVQAVADMASSTKTWRIEGSVEDSEYKPPATFSLFMRAPAEVRFEENNSRIPAIIVCDTANAWVYSPPLNRYRMQPASESTLCSPIVGDWKSLPITLKSLELAGHRKLEIGGKTIDCQMVRGKSEAKPPLSGEIKRELCVDANSGLILWEEEKFSGARRTYTYTKIDRDIVMAADVFMPVLPPGSQSTPYELPMPVRLGFPIMGDDSVARCRASSLNATRFTTKDRGRRTWKEL